MQPFGCSLPLHAPLLLRRDGSLVGFALLNANSHTGQPVERNVAAHAFEREEHDINDSHWNGPVIHFQTRS